MISRPARLKGLSAAFALSLALAGCSSLGTGSVTDLPAPDDAQFGTGAIKVGMLVEDQADELSSGAPNSTFLAAQLNAQTVAKAPITLIVRHYDGTPEGLKAAEQLLSSQGVSLVIGPDDAVVSLGLASELGRKGVPIMSLGSASDAKTNLYAFAMDGETEASLMADEMRRRLYRQVVLVSNPNGSERIFTSQLASSIAKINVGLVSVDGTDPVAAAKRITAIVAGGQIPSAIVFAQSAKSAAAVMTELRRNPKLAGVPVVGVSSWSFEATAAASAGPGWYLAPEGNSISDFSARFLKAFNALPTPDGALAYDLIVMAAALPQAVPGQSPYAREVLANEQGFKGVTGKFWFTPDGQVHRNLLPVDIAPGLARPAT